MRTWSSSSGRRSFFAMYCVPVRSIGVIESSRWIWICGGLSTVPEAPAGAKESKTTLWTEGEGEVGARRG
jgi:hypothetical protein